MSSRFNWTIGKTYRYVIHKHLAKRAGLHYDFRIERDDKNLDSFATRHNPTTLKSGNRQLLIRQPLHDSKWLNFQGEIKSGYGAGKLSIVDKGKITILKKDSKHVTFIANGQKLKGEYAIIYLDDDRYLLVKAREKRNNG